VRELPPPYPVDAPQSHEPLTYRGQSPTYQSPTYQRNPAPRNTVALDDYPRDPAPVARRPRNVIPTQFAPSGGGRQLGGMGRPQPYTQAPASAAYAPPANDPYLPPPPATTNLAPSAPVVPP